MTANFNGLKKLQEGMQELGETDSISLPELMPPSFIVQCSKYKDLQDLFDSSGFKMDTPEDFKAIPDNEWDAFIQENTSFDSWESMQAAAAEAWIKEKLGFS